MPENFHRKKHLTSFQMIILGFAGVILLGTLLLMLPVSSADGIVTPFDEALFTSTSAVCVCFPEEKYLLCSAALCRAQYRHRR